MDHVATLRAYSWPIVIRAFQKYGLPGQLEDLAARERGPLAVALAAELASITTRLLVGALRRIRPESREELRSPRYFKDADPRDALDQAFRERQTAYRLVQNMERCIQGLLPDGTLVFTNEVGSSENHKNLAEEIFRLPQSWPARDELQSLLPEYCTLSARHVTAANRHRDCRKVTRIKQMPPVGTEIKASAKAKPCVEPKGPFNDLRIDFSGPFLILNGGCADRLRQHHAAWWERVTSYIQSNVRVNLKNNTVKFLLRHPTVVKDILRAQSEWSQKADETRAATTLGVLKQHADHDFFVPSEWMDTNLVFDKFKSLMVVLKTEDKMAKEWIQNNDSLSPYNIYETQRVTDFASQKPALKKELLRLLEPPS